MHYLLQQEIRRGIAPEGWQLADIQNLLVDTPAGARVPLQTLADIRKEAGPNYISREQVERKIVVMCNVAGRDVTSVVQDCSKVLNPIVAAQAGYRVEYGGQFESAEEASRIIALLGVAVVIGIAFLLHLAFGSAREAALIMLNLPLALIGGVVGVFVSGGVLSVASLIGFITVFGIATRNGIMHPSLVKALVEKKVGDFCKKRVPAHVLDKLNLSNKIRGNNVTIFERQSAVAFRYERVDFYGNSTA